MCEAELKEPSCPCGISHGWGYTEPSEWAAKIWPDHTCFTQPSLSQEDQPS